jgi:putative oxidoreductase
MNSKALLILKIIFGVLLAIFGANKFFNFMPAPEEMPEGIMNYMTALMATKTMYLVGAVELIAGLSLIFNKYAPLLMIILMSVSINAVLFHATLDPENSVGAIILLVLNIVMLYAFKNKYKDLLKG